MKTICSIHLSVGALLLSSAAVHAQSAADPRKQGGEVQSTSGSDVGIQDIVVTAQKQSQILQKLPAAVTAVEGAILAARGISDIRQANSLSPATSFKVENNVAQVYIRGVGSGIDNSFIPESVAMQTNGVYTPRYVTASGLYDLDRIEVLPGPQGTLYGRSAVGGVITINTKRPSDEFGVEASAEAGNYQYTHFTAAMNVPVSDTTAVRAAVDYNHRGPWNNIGTDTQNGFGARLSLLAKPSDNLRIFLWGSYYQNNNRLAPLYDVPLPKNPRKNTPVLDPHFAFLGFLGYPEYIGGYDNRRTSSRVRNYLLGAEIEWDLGGVTATYIPGWVKYSDVNTRPLGGMSMDVALRGEMFSNELRLSNSNPDSSLKWILGGYQFHTRDPFYFTIGPIPGNTAPMLGGNDLVSKSDSYAAFGQATYSVTDALRLTAGGRYSYSNLKTSNAQAFFPADALFNRGIIVFDYKDSWTHFDWKVGAEADIAPRSMLYANVQTGFNPGTFVASPPVPNMPIKPQKMLGFTAGSKNRFLDNKLQLNLEAFYYRYKDFIVQTFCAAGPPRCAGIFLVFNAPRSRMYGLQLDSVYALSPETNLRLNASYLNAKITRAEFNNGLGVVDLKGNTLTNAPKWTIAAGIDQAFPLASGAEVRLSVNSAYNSGYWMSYDHVPANLRQKSFTKTDINLSYAVPDKNLEIGLFVRNLENENTISGGAPTAGGTGAAYLEAPRTYGVRLQGKI